MATTTTVHDVRVALIDVSNPAAPTGAVVTAVAALNLGRVTYGWGWRPDLDGNAVLLMDARSTQSWRTSNRGRNEAAEIEVLFLAHNAKGEQAAADQAFAMLEAVDRACRLGVGGDGLGGIVEEIVLASTEYTVWNDNRSDRAAGGFAYLLATFATRAIIRG